MAKVGREMVERVGVNVDQLADLLVKNAAAELTTYYERFPVVGTLREG
jgi:ferritin-like protein